MLLASSLLISSLTGFAKPISKDNLQIMSLTDAHSFIGISQSDFNQAITQNLINAISHSLDHKENFNLFGQKQLWKSSKKLQVNEAGTYILRLGMSTERFVEGKLKIEGIEKISVFVNGKKISGTNSFDITLLNGDHRLLIVAEKIADWSKVVLDWSNKGEQKIEKNYVQFNDDSNKARLSPEKMFDSETVNNLQISPDGKVMLISKQHYSDVTKNTAQTLVELVEPNSMKVVYRWQGIQPYLTSWSNNNKYLAYSHSNNIYLLNRSNLNITKVASDLKGVRGIQWFNDRTLILSWHKPEEKPHQFTKRYRGLEDRWSYWRGQTQIYLLDIKSGFIKQVTQNTLGSTLLDFDSDKQKILLSRSPIDYKEPAHGITHVFELNLKKNKEKLLGKFRTFNTAKYTKDGVVFTAGPGLKNNIGSILEKEQSPNNYDSQLYLMKSNGDIKALSKSFKPAIGEFRVLKNDSLILSVTDGDKRQLYHFYKNKFKRIKTAVEVVETFSVSKESKAQLIYTGTNAVSPQKTYLTQVGRSKQKLLIDTAKASYSNIRFGEFNDWDYTTQKGHQIDGRYYLPANFEPNKKYPAIIYYYGGTAPVSRAFTGRWPFSLWAAQGYVVYVLQPSGTIGYGQKYSAKHVNAWGLETADDIIESTQAFVKAHPFVDADKLGNMGASYGGFMTMYLATKTDIFSASISHAGISNLTSYWGHGWWGYGYSGVATNGNFPWNNSEFYTQQSPVFHADKVKTPLLLLHGDADTNVPVGESHQMYTALKLLNKEVELIEFQGDDHHINSRDHRLRWWNTILSYFDKQLKNQPEWWESLYPEKK